MEPQINSTQFGSITIERESFEHDVIIRLNGKVKKRKKKLSKAIYRTSHTISQDEARHIYQERAERIIIGTGQYDTVRLSAEAEKYFRQRHCEVELISIPKAISFWNESKGSVIGLFHVTC